MDILSRIIKYESDVFEEYTSKRQKLLDNIKNIDITSLNKQQQRIFIHDIKSIIDPIKTSVSEIDYYFTNTNFTKTESITNLNFIYRLLVLRGISSSELSSSSETEISESESDSESISVPDSESNSSRSVSVTFSSKKEES